MQPLDSIAAPETGLRIADGAVCLTRSLPASESGAPFPLLPCELPQKDAAVRRRLMARAPTRRGSFDAGLASPPRAEATPKANDGPKANDNILLEPGGNAMTQLSKATEELAGDAPAAGSTSVDKPGHPGRRLLGNSGPHAPQSALTPERSAAVVPPGAEMWAEARAAAQPGTHEMAIGRLIREAQAPSRQGSHGRAAAAYTHGAGEGIR